MAYPANESPDYFARQITIKLYYRRGIELHDATDKTHLICSTEISSISANARGEPRELSSGSLQPVG